jgi:rRNA-processing protein FCF1
MINAFKVNGAKGRINAVIGKFEKMSKELDESISILLSEISSNVTVMENLKTTNEEHEKEIKRAAAFRDKLIQMVG